MQAWTYKINVKSNWMCILKEIIKTKIINYMDNYILCNQDCCGWLARVTSTMINVRMQSVSVSGSSATKASIFYDLIIATNGFENDLHSLRISYVSTYVSHYPRRIHICMSGCKLSNLKYLKTHTYISNTENTECREFFTNIVAPVFLNIEYGKLVKYT